VPEPRLYATPTGLAAIVMVIPAMDGGVDPFGKDVPCGSKGPDVRPFRRAAWLPGRRQHGSATCRWTDVPCFRWRAAWPIPDLRGATDERCAGGAASPAGRDHRCGWLTLSRKPPSWRGAGSLSWH